MTGAGKTGKPVEVTEAANGGMELVMMADQQRWQGLDNVIRSAEVVG